MKKLIAFVIACLLAIAAADAEDLGPSGSARRLVLSPACRVKLRIAYRTIADMDPLSEPYEWSDQQNEAKRAIREAQALADTKDEKEAIRDIATYKLVREACRARSTVDAYEECHRDGYRWSDRIQYELGISDAPPRATKPSAK
jgi:hypothetical protein